MLGSALFLGLCVVTSAFAGHTATPKPPTFTYLYSSNVTLGPTIDYGAGPRGHRVAIPITGGTLSGPRIKGNFINLGADWGAIDNLGVFNPDTRYGILTDDGANIYIQTSGPTQKDGHTHLRMIFETAANSTYSWLNEIVAVGILTGGSGYVSIDAWQVESP